MPSPDFFRPWQRRLAVFLTALLIRLLYLYLIRDNPFFDSPVIDAQTYDEQAQQIARGSWSNGETFWQPPLYPYFLGILYTVLGRDLLWVRVIQAIIGSLTCVLASELAYRHGSTWASLATGLLLALYGPLVFIDGELLVPVLSLPLDLATLLLLTPHAMKSLTKARLATAGFCLGLSAIARPTVLMFGGGFLIWLLWPIQARPIRPRLIGVALFVLAALVPIAPVTLHNVVFGHEWVMISSNGGINFYLGNNADYDQMVGIRPGIAWKTLMLEPGLHGAQSPASTSDYWLDQACSFFREHPLDALLLQTKKVLLLIQAHDIPRNLDYYFFLKHFAPLLGRLVQFGVLLPLALPALLWAWKRRYEHHHVVWLLFLFTNATSIVAFFVTGRYRLTLVPLLAVYAGLTINLLLDPNLGQRARYRLLALAAMSALIIQADPFRTNRIDEAEGFNLIGKALSNANRHSEAIAAFLKARDKDRDNMDVVFNLGREYQIQQRCDLAVPHYQQARAAYPLDRDTLNNLGICELALGHYQEGVALLEQVVTIYPDGSDVYFNLAQAYQASYRLNDARKTLEAGLRVDPGSAALQGALLEVEAAIGLNTALEAAWQATITRLAENGSTAQPAEAANPIPEQARTLNNEGHQLLVQGNIASARARFIAALLTSPAYPTAWSNLGQCHYLSGQFEEARTAFQRALTLNPRYWTAAIGLGLTFANGLKDFEGCRRILMDVIREAPERERTRAEELLQNYRDR